MEVLKSIIKFLTYCFYRPKRLLETSRGLRFVTRFNYETENLKEADCINGYGVDVSLLCKILELRKRNKVEFFLDDFTSQTDFLTASGPQLLLGQVITNKKTGKQCIIDSIHKHWYFGYYWYALYRIMGTNSHGTLVVKNINSICPSIDNDDLNDWTPLLTQILKELE